MIVSSRENATYTIEPTRNFTQPRTTASYERGSADAIERTSSTVAARLVLIATRHDREPRNLVDHNAPAIAERPLELSERCRSRIDRDLDANDLAGGNLGTHQGQVVAVAESRQQPRLSANIDRRTECFCQLRGSAPDEAKRNSSHPLLDR